MDNVSIKSEKNVSYAAAAEFVSEFLVKSTEPDGLATQGKVCQPSCNVASRSDVDSSGMKLYSKWSKW